MRWPERSGVASQGRRDDRIGINPIAWDRETAFGRALETHLTARSCQFNDLNLPAGNGMPALCAESAIVERMPKMEFIEETQEIEFVLRRETHGCSAHARKNCRLAVRPQSVGKRAGPSVECLSLR